MWVFSLFCVRWCYRHYDPMSNAGRTVRTETPSRSIFPISRGLSRKVRAHTGFVVLFCLLRDGLVHVFSCRGIVFVVGLAPGTATALCRRRTGWSTIAPVRSACSSKAFLVPITRTPGRATLKTLAPRCKASCRAPRTCPVGAIRYTWLCVVNFDLSAVHLYTIQCRARSQHCSLVGE